MAIDINNLQVMFTTLLESGGVVIPSLLLKFYSRLNITELEMMVLLHLLHWRQVEQERFPTPEKISQYMKLDNETIKNLIASLIEKKIITVEPYYNSTLGRWQNSFNFAPLWSKLAQLVLGNVNSILASDEIAATADSKYGNLYHSFEKEFGRPLSPLESDQLKTWLQKEQLPVELLQEALRRAVLRGALNFRYIDSILCDWQRHNIRTVAEAIVFDEKRKRKSRSPRTIEKKAAKNDKYRELYRLYPKG